MHYPNAKGCMKTYIYGMDKNLVIKPQIFIFSKIIN